MKILYAEDEQIKANQVMNFLKSLNYYNIKLVKSYISTLKELHDNKYDLLLLDMSLPLHNSTAFYEEDFETYAGLDILDEIDRIGLDIKVIVITAFDVLGEGNEKKTLDQLNEEMSKNFSENYIGIVYYDSSTLEWNSKLEKLLDTI
ncbi:response regulator [Thomasclavelia spiroformis]|uniref:response regulator n=1 Tax=Thomasclavelia spiroformis TaxID=29348 RepID=UPI00241F9DF4|nr:response regulator [Thomasclavelia spiroformis]MBS6686484.1 response regulator [Thomasclavelia spiroformis]